MNKDKLKTAGTRIAVAISTIVGVIIVAATLFFIFDHALRTGHGEGFRKAQTQFQREAIEAGVASWIIHDVDGNTTFILASKEGIVEEYKASLPKEIEAKPAKEKLNVSRKRAKHTKPVDLKTDV